MNIAGEPVINYIVRKLLQLEGEDRIDAIYILLRKKQQLPSAKFHPESVELDLERDFNLWEKNWFWKENERIHLVYEEDLKDDEAL